MKLIYIENYHRHSISAQDRTMQNIYVLCVQNNLGSNGKTEP